MRKSVRIRARSFFVAGTQGLNIFRRNPYRDPASSITAMKALRDEFTAGLRAMADDPRDAAAARSLGAHPAGLAKQSSLWDDEPVAAGGDPIIPHCAYGGLFRPAQHEQYVRFYFWHLKALVLGGVMDWKLIISCRFSLRTILIEIQIHWFFFVAPARIHCSGDVPLGCKCIRIVFHNCIKKQATSYVLKEFSFRVWPCLWLHFPPNSGLIAVFVWWGFFSCWVRLTQWCDLP